METALSEGHGLRYSYFTTVDNRDNRLAYRELLTNLTEQTRLCEDAGFAAVWTGEHHFGHEGFDIHPNPVITGAHLAAKTETIRIGFLALIATEWHPLRLAEDVAMVDQLSGGRVECGLGRGLAVRELTNLSPNADRRNNKRNEAFFEEIIEVVRKAWTEDPFTHDGLFFQFPQRGVRDHTTAWYDRDPRYRAESGEYVGMRIVPHPLQTPHPPLWNVTDSLSGFRFSAQMGMRPVCWLPSTPGIVDAFTAYRDEVARVEGTELAPGERCGLLRTCFVAETMEEAKRIAEEPIEFLYSKYIAGYRGRNIFANHGETLSADDEMASWFDFLADRDHLLVGTPEYVAEKIIALREQTGVEDLSTLMWLPGVEHRDIMRSIELFGERVVPLVDQAVQPVAGSAR
jgi:alkanesulfonate monooxygenase SsuD/methylene tetrahydromethanopterin reductase-like flavin-dependent oxidoreductase (luciferase family)